MAAITKANAVIEAAKLLCDTTYAVYYGKGTVSTSTYLESLCDRVAHEISVKHPLLKRCNLALVDGTWDFDLGSLDYLRIHRVFYPTNEKTVRSINQFGSTCQLVMDDEEPPTVTSGTLTGTVTFTNGSRAVTGSGTAFLTELAEDYLICKGKVADAAYKWYRILSITDDENLILVELFEESSGADTVSLTKYRDEVSCVSLLYHGAFTVSTTSDMPARFDDLLVLGIMAHATRAFAGSKACDYLGDNETDFTAAIAKIPTNNVGGDEAAKYAQLIAQRTASAQMISSYKSWAAGLWQEYQEGLKNIKPFKSHNFGSRIL